MPSRPQWWPPVRCGADMPDFFHHVTTFCGRPKDHPDDGHWPVALASDRPKENHRD